MTLHMYPWLTGSYSLTDDSLYMHIIVHISCVIIPVYFNHMFPFWLDHIVNTYVHYLLMSPDICYLMYTVSLICPSPHRRMISPLCSTFQYYPTTNNIYLAASICMQKISLQILVYFVSLLVTRHASSMLPCTKQNTTKRKSHVHIIIFVLLSQIASKGNKIY